MHSKATRHHNFHTHKLSLILTLMLLVGSSQSQAESTVPAKSGQWHYQIMFDKAPVGSMQIAYQVNNDRYLFESQSQLTISSFWGDTQLQSRLSETHLMDGTLIQADNLLNQDDNTHWTKIELKNNEYLTMGSQLPTLGQQEIAELTDLVKQAVIQMVPNAGHVITLGEVLLTDENNAMNNSRLSKTDFDTSFAALPLYWQQHGYTLPKQLTVFDTENMLLFHATSQFMGEEILVTHAGEIPSYHYQLTLEDKSSLHLWLAKSNQDVSFFAQIKGQDNGNDYTVSLAK
ncbi:hypothetical protein [Motilimonas eburnea]|uniref:hypothetical protein n=1 Tax=Motilimonas eburnea TaxID=1737488 RepID=UPI001E521C43|nr:hypothetical protein [Motilimonas eburnea]MCE2571177.1 hypothetical protein [Motilimonas eburnea]